jgi:hypothetical protein
MPAPLTGPLDDPRVKELERRLRAVLIEIDPDPGSALYVLGKLLVVALAQFPAADDADVLAALTGDVANMRQRQQEGAPVVPRVTLN